MSKRAMIAELGLSARVRAPLAREGLRYVDQLLVGPFEGDSYLSLPGARAHVLDVSGIGVGGWLEICRAMAEWEDEQR